MSEAPRQFLFKLLLPDRVVPDMKVLAEEVDPEMVTVLQNWRDEVDREREVMMKNAENGPMRKVEISEAELHKVMQDRLAEALFANDSKQGVILLVGTKPGISYAHTRMSAREHVHAARVLLINALLILEEKDIEHEGASVLVGKSGAMIDALLKEMPSELPKDMQKNTTPPEDDNDE
jgi:hypothetical protein